MARQIHNQYQFVVCKDFKGMDWYIQNIAIPYEADVSKWKEIMLKVLEADEGVSKNDLKELFGQKHRKKGNKMKITKEKMIEALEVWREWKNLGSAELTDKRYEFFKSLGENLSEKMENKVLMTSSPTLMLITGRLRAWKKS